MFKVDVDNVNGKTESLFVYGEHSILVELEAYNVFINYSCRQGHCGTCILKLIEGEVLHQDSLIPLSQGEILACRAKPVSDIRICERGL